jgi:hypothetical protein
MFLSDILDRIDSSFELGLYIGGVQNSEEFSSISVDASKDCWEEWKLGVLNEDVLFRFVGITKAVENDKSIKRTKTPALGRLSKTSSSATPPETMKRNNTAKSRYKPKFRPGSGSSDGSESQIVHKDLFDVSSVSPRNFENITKRLTERYSELLIKHYEVC